jgi:hypothetical protein
VANAVRATTTPKEALRALISTRSLAPEPAVNLACPARGAGVGDDRTSDDGEPRIGERGKARAACILLILAA